MNRNHIITDEWSNPITEELFKSYSEEEREKLRWPEQDGPCHECMFCEYYGAFNYDWGLCCYEKGDYFRETIFEHFICNEFEQVRLD